MVMPVENIRCFCPEYPANIRQISERAPADFLIDIRIDWCSKCTKYPKISSRISARALACSLPPHTGIRCGYSYFGLKIPFSKIVTFSKIFTDFKNTKKNFKFQIFGFCSKSPKPTTRIANSGQVPVVYRTCIGSSVLSAAGGSHTGDWV